MPKTVSVSELSHGAASRAIREAQVEPVLVSKEHRPASWIVSAERLAQVARARGAAPDVYERALDAIAVDLYRDGVLTLGQGAKLAGMTFGDFIDLCGDLGVPILWGTPDELAADVDSLARSLPPPPASAPDARG
jgi:predicted HTH domain antitoxin